MRICVSYVTTQKKEQKKKGMMMICLDCVQTYTVLANKDTWSAKMIIERVTAFLTTIARTQIAIKVIFFIVFVYFNIYTNSHFFYLLYAPFPREGSFIKKRGRGKEFSGYNIAPVTSSIAGILQQQNLSCFPHRSSQ